MESFTGQRKGTVRIGGKPMFVFQGEEFESNPEFATFQNLILGDLHSHCDLEYVARRLRFIKMYPLHHFATQLNVRFF